MNNDQVGQRTKRIDIKWHHIKEMIREEQLRTEYMKSEENPGNIMTKNTKHHQVRSWCVNSTSAHCPQKI